jgi:hypothetical protein
MVLTAEIVDAAYVLTAFSYLIVMLRLTLRRLNHDRFTWDDYAIIAAAIFYGLNTAAFPIVVSRSFQINPTS